VCDVKPLNLKVSGTLYKKTKEVLKVNSINAIPFKISTEAILLSLVRE
jgi:hypothetical protein